MGKRKHKIHHYDEDEIILEDYWEDDFAKEREKYKAKSRYSPLPFSRIVIAGESGSGKTRLLINYLLNSKLKPVYSKIFLCIPDASENKYVKLVEYFEDLIQNMVDTEKITQEQADNLERPYEFITSPQDLPELDDDFKKKYPGHNILVFDDCITLSKQDQQTIATYFIKSRKYNITTIYIGQVFHKLDIVIRKNTTCFIMFSEGQATANKANANTVGMSDACRDIYTHLKKYDFVVINKEPQIDKAREMINFKPIKMIKDYF